MPREPMEIERQPAAAPEISKIGSNIPRKYRIVKLVGQGSFGKVYEGYDELRHRKVAIKRVMKLSKQMSREILLCYAVKALPHCVALLDCFYTWSTNSEHIFQNMIFEYIPRTLSRMIREHKQVGQCMPVALVQHLFRQLLQGLALLRQQGICHRDLKPENILIEQDLALKICDFGSAKRMEQGPPRHTPYVVSRFYRAPELMLGCVHYDYAIDMWAAGCVLAEMCLGRPLFAGENDSDQIVKVITILGSPSDSDLDELAMLTPKENRAFLQHIRGLQAMSLRLAFGPYAAAAALSDAAATDLLDLIAGLLRYNPRKRLTAEQALRHPFMQRSFPTNNTTLTAPASAAVAPSPA